MTGKTKRERSTKPGATELEEDVLDQASGGNAQSMAKMNMQAKVESKISPDGAKWDYGGWGAE